MMQVVQQSYTLQLKFLQNSLITLKFFYINSNKNSALTFNLNQKTNCGSYATPSIQSKIQVQAATASDQEAAQTIATNIWGASIANSWDYNAEVGVVLSQAVEAINTCSVTLDWQ